MNESPGDDLPAGGVFPPVSAARLMELGFHTQAPGTADGVPDEISAGMMIGRYELLEPLGTGGCGVVWRARQRDPILREVALKLIKPGLGSGGVMARFEAERQALALMDHPNIAAVLDAGAAAGGRPYFVMELVRGEPLTEYCDRRRLTLRERIGLFIPVCLAVQHAHQKAVLHRDLKPSNILVAEIDGHPVPKVIDFGIAKALGPAADALHALRSGETLAGTVVGTPQYMSPEQAGCGLDVDTRSDIYALGVILCELLTGRTPFSGDPADLPRILRWICEGESVRPSALVQPPVTPEVARAAEQRRLVPERFARGLRGDLDWITLKATEKDRARRYETATALATDLRRSLEGKTVSAAEPAWAYRLGKFTRRHRIGLLAAGVAVTALVTGTILSLWQAAKAEDSRVKAEDSKVKSEISRAEAEGSRREAEKNFARAREAVEKYLNSVTEHPKLQETDFQDLQKSLLETALPFYEELVQDRGRDPKLRGDRASALGRLANLHQGLEQYDKAEAAYLQSLDLENQLAREFPENPAWPEALAMRYNNFAILKRSQGRRQEALADYTRAVELTAGLRARFPDNPQHVHRHGIFRLHRGQLLGELGQRAEAEQVYLEALADQEKLTAAHPEDIAFLHQTGVCYTALGSVRGLVKRYDEAGDDFRKAIGIYGETIRRSGGDAEYRRVRASTLSNLGDVLLWAGRDQEAEEATAKSCAEYQRLAAEFPSYNHYLWFASRREVVLGELYAKRNAEAESLAAWERAVSGYQRLVTVVPGSAVYAKELGQTLATLGAAALARKETKPALDFYRQAAAACPAVGYQQQVCALLLKNRDFTAAEKAALDWASAESAGWEPREHAARVLLRVAGALPVDAESTAAKRDALLAEIVHQLKQAAAQGFAGLADLEGNPAVLEMLRARQDFQQLRAAPPPPAPQGMPGRFSVDYPHGDDAGIRRWQRDGMTWTETQPSGEQHHFKITGAVTVNKLSGVQLRRDGETELMLFIPNLGSQGNPYLRMLQDDGTWESIGTMTELEE